MLYPIWPISVWRCLTNAAPSSAANSVAMSADTPAANIASVANFNRVILLSFRPALFVTAKRVQFCQEARGDFGQCVEPKGIATSQDNNSPYLTGPASNTAG